MGWDTRINAVVHALAAAIYDLNTIGSIAKMSGLTMQNVINSHDAASYWANVLDRAQDEGDQRVDSVLQEALTRTRNPMVYDAVKTYWAERGR